jgi:archaellum component FlaD/FlaE
VLFVFLVKLSLSHFPFYVQETEQLDEYQRCCEDLAQLLAQHGRTEEEFNAAASAGSSQQRSPNIVDYEPVNEKEEEDRVENSPEKTAHRLVSLIWFDHVVNLTSVTFRIRFINSLGYS